MNAIENTVRPKVLVVDDSRMVRASISKHIRGHFDIREEDDGETGWQTLLVDPDIQIVLTDIGMPHLDGYGLLARMRASKVPRIRAMPVIIVSGDDDAEAKQKALELGANDFIVKGISSPELLARLSRLYSGQQTGEVSSPSVAANAEVPEAETARPPVAATATAESAGVPDFVPSMAVPPVRGGTETVLGGPNSEWRSMQELAFATLLQTDLSRTAMSAIAVEIDHFDQLVEWHGSHVTRLIARKLVKILAGKLRKEDSVAQLAPSQFGILAPGLGAVDCMLLAQQLHMAVEKLVMSYRGERIQISVAMGVACSATDGGRRANQLIDVAVRRAKAGRDAGGNRIVSDDQEVTAQPQQEAKPVSDQSAGLDLFLLKLRSGATKQMAAELPQVIDTLLPLLEFIESSLHCGMPIDKLNQYLGKHKNTRSINR